MNNFSLNLTGYNECVSRGVCSVLPSISALQEVLFVIVKQTAYYIIKIKEFNLNVAAIEKAVINILAYCIASNDMTEISLLSVISYAYGNLEKLRNEFYKACKNYNITLVDMKKPLKLSPAMSLPQIISLGETLFRYKYKKISKSRKNYTEIITYVIKSLSMKIAKSYLFSENIVSDISNVISALNLLNNRNLSINKLKNEINNLLLLDNDASSKLFALYKEYFGEITTKNVSHSSSKGKAILVSGSNLSDLKILLDSVNGLEIDIYTHGELLVAHSYEEFCKYKSLKGHFGNCYDNCLLDFANFPGAILLTQDSGVNTDYIYRGRLFSTSPISMSGVIKINNYDFSPIITSAQSAKGFAKNHEKFSEIVGIDLKNLDNNINELCEKLESGVLKGLVILDFSLYSRPYTENLVSLIPDDIFIISFTKDLPRSKNILIVNLGNNREHIRYIISYISRAFVSVNENISVFLSSSDISSCANILYLKTIGVKNIYLTDSPRIVINPEIKDFIKLEYCIKSTTKPEDDVKNLFEYK